jgi:hypothetical protein
MVHPLRCSYISNPTNRSGALPTLSGADRQADFPPSCCCRLRRPARAGVVPRSSFDRSRQMSKKVCDRRAAGASSLPRMTDHNTSNPSPWRRQLLYPIDFARNRRLVSGLSMTSHSHHPSPILEVALRLLIVSDYSDIECSDLEPFQRPHAIFRRFLSWHELCLLFRLPFSIFSVCSELPPSSCSGNRTITAG